MQSQASLLALGAPRPFRFTDRRNLALELKWPSFGRPVPLGETISGSDERLAVSSLWSLLPDNSGSVGLFMAMLQMRRLFGSIESEMNVIHQKARIKYFYFNLINLQSSA